MDCKFFVNYMQIEKFEEDKNSEFCSKSEHKTFGPFADYLEAENWMNKELIKKIKVQYPEVRKEIGHFIEMKTKNITWNFYIAKFENVK